MAYVYVHSHSLLLTLLWPHYCSAPVGSSITSFPHVVQLFLFTLQMEEDKDTIYKQGYLIKQGGLVKTWKRRLFVLDNEGLSYYKTEQVRCV